MDQGEMKGAVDIKSDESGSISEKAMKLLKDRWISKQEAMKVIKEVLDREQAMGQGELEGAMDDIRDGSGSKR